MGARFCLNVAWWLFFGLGLVVLDGRVEGFRRADAL